MIVSALIDLRTGKSVRVWGPMVLALAGIGWLLWQTAQSS